MTTATARTDTHDEATVSLKHTIDSVIVRETVIIREGPDTVAVVRERTVWRERTVHDTVRIHATDTIVRTETVERVVTEARPSRAGTAGWAVAAALFLLMAVYIAVKTLLKR